MEVGNITKAANFKSSLHLGYKNTQILFLWTVLFNTFMRQTLTDDFGGLHKNMNCAFPLMCTVKKWSDHGIIIGTGITCKKISCHMRDSDCRWLIVENAKMFRSYVKHFLES